MKLIIREYLSLLKESKELDRIIPDLLLMMGFEPLSYAQIGVRQFGVDVAATKKNSEGKNELLLFTIKQGDIGRKDWDSNEQSVRQSLEEIKDVYLENYIRPEHKDFIKKIVVCTGGILKQEIEPNWTSYIKKNTINDVVEYEFWGGDKLAMYLEEFMFNEQIIPLQYRTLFRKVLCLLSDPDYNYHDYYKILEGMLIDANFGDFNNPTVIQKSKKALRTVHLLLNITFYWSVNENNLKPSVYFSERTLLITWEFIRKNSLESKKSIMKIYFEIYNSFFNIYSRYFEKVQDYCFLKNGFHGYSGYSILENKNIFEQLGLISTCGLTFIFQAIIEKNENLYNDTKNIVESLKAYINNHSSSSTPFYDEYIIEISEAIYLLSLFKEIEFIDNWINIILNRVAYAYNSMGKYFPIDSDSFDDLIALSISGTKNKEELSKISTLLPILAQWCAVLDLNDSYTLLVDIINKLFKHTTFQIWYPDEMADSFLYMYHAAFKSGVVDAPMNIPVSMLEMKKMIRSVNKKIINLKDLTSVKNGFSILPIISSRHFRTPFLPQFWQSLLDSKVDNNI